MTPDPSDEFARQRALDSYRVLDTMPEQAYDDIVQLAATLCGAPIALVSLIDRDRQWAKAKIGMDETQVSRDIAFCDHAIREPHQLLEVPDTMRDARFSDNPFVALGDGMRFYAGMPLVTPSGCPIGTVCVADSVPRRLNDAQRAALGALSRLTINLMEAHARERALQRAATLHAAPAATLASTAAATGYTVAIIEMQGYATFVSHSGDRVAERLLEQLDATLEACIRPASGDVLNRATGSVECIAVIQGDDASATLEALQRGCDMFSRENGVQVLMASAPSASPGEAPEMVFLRADEALSMEKDRLMHQARAA